MIYMYYVSLISVRKKNNKKNRVSHDVDLTNGRVQICKH